MRSVWDEAVSSPGAYVTVEWITGANIIEAYKDAAVRHAVEEERIKWINIVDNFIMAYNLPGVHCEMEQAVMYALEAIQGKEASD